MLHLPSPTLLHPHTPRPGRARRTTGHSIVYMFQIDKRETEGGRRGRGVVMVSQLDLKHKPATMRAYGARGARGGVVRVVRNPDAGAPAMRRAPSALVLFSVHIRRSARACTSSSSR